MGFWDYLAKLFGVVPPPEPAAESGPLAPRAETTSPPPTASPVEPAKPLAERADYSPPGTVASDFLPIARDDMIAEGEDVRRTPGWMWFGRRDIIPPVTDPRTLLIDRGMLTQGFLDADELVEIHKTGIEWDKYANRF